MSIEHSLTIVDDYGKDVVVIDRDGINISFQRDNLKQFLLKQSDIMSLGVVNVTKPPYFADNTGALDASAAINAAIAVYDGRPIYCPAGEYRIDNQLLFSTTNPGSPTLSSTGGLKLYGDGSLKTIFHSNVANAPMIKLIENTEYKFQFGMELKGFKITGQLYNPVNATGIFIERVYFSQLEDVQVERMSLDGIIVNIDTLGAGSGDGDSTNWLTLKRCIVYFCKGWGLNLDIVAGSAAVSFLTLDHTWIHECGTYSADYIPPSGGMKYGGIECLLQNSAITESENCGLYVYGRAGVFTALNTAFQNNRQKNIFITYCLGFQLFACSLYANVAPYTSTYGILLDATTPNLIRNVRIYDLKMRAPAVNNPYYGFDIVGTLVDRVVIDNTEWNDFDHPGQVRFGPGFYGAGTRTRISESGYEIRGSAPMLITTLTTPGAFIPDALLWKIHHIKMTATGAYTISTPIKGQVANGQELVITIDNRSGGAITVTFAAAFIKTGYVDPGNNQYTSATFYFQSAYGWIQCTPWVVV